MLTSTTHTPGPWTCLATNDGRSKRYIRTADMIAVAKITGAGRSYAEQEANTRLIVAAPDLLAALQHLMRYDFGDSDGAKEARAAIAKATGHP